MLTVYIFIFFRLLLVLRGHSGFSSPVYVLCLFVGLTDEEGLELLGKYVDLTSDIQTAALAMVYSCPSELAHDDRVRTWIER